MSLLGGPDGHPGVMRAGCGALHVPSPHAGMVPPLILFNRIFWKGTGAETAFSFRSEREQGLRLPFPQKECFGI